MALDRLYQIRCDRCGEQSGFWQDSPRHARTAARREGWLSVSRALISNFARLDYCPACVELNYGDEANNANLF